MNTQEVLDAIDADSAINQNKLDSEVLGIPRLYSKWYRIYMDEMRVYKRISVEFAKKKKERTHFYLGKAPDEAYEKERLEIKVLKTDLDLYLDADEELAILGEKMNTQKLKVELIENFMKGLNNRGFNIKTAVDFMRFQAGSY